MAVPYNRTFVLDLGGVTGLTLSAQLYTYAGVASGNAVTSGFFEHGAGFYTWDGTIPDLSFRGSVQFYTAGPVIRDVQNINPDFTAARWSGSGTVPVDHNYGGSDNLSYRTSLNTGIDNAEVNIFNKTDYDAGNRGNQFIVGATRTTTLGRWSRPVMLDPGTYTIVYFRQGFSGPDTKEVTVT